MTRKVLLLIEDRLQRVVKWRVKYIGIKDDALNAKQIKHIQIN